MEGNFRIYTCSFHWLLLKSYDVLPQGWVPSCSSCTQTRRLWMLFRVPTSRDTRPTPTPYMHSVESTVFIKITSASPTVLYNYVLNLRALRDAATRIVYSLHLHWEDGVFAGTAPHHAHCALCLRSSCSLSQQQFFRFHIPFINRTSILFFLHYVYGLRRRFHSHSAVGVALDQSLPEKMLQVFWKWLVGAFFPKTKCNTYSTLTLPSFFDCLPAACVRLLHNL